MSRANDGGSSARYYANSAEQQILIRGLQQYFGLPERSQNRNRIAKDVSQILCQYSPHWTHRAVRLWFNNNKHTYFNPEVPLVPPGPAPPPLMLPPALPMMPPHPPILQPPQLPQPQQPPQLPPQPPPPPPPQPPLPAVGLPPRSLQIPIPQIEQRHPVDPIVLMPIQLPKSGSNSYLSEKPKIDEKPGLVYPSIPPFQPRNGTPGFQTLAPISFYHKGDGEQSLDQSYEATSSLLREMKKVPEHDPRAAKLIEDYDRACNSLKSRFGTIQADRVDPQTMFVPFPARRETQNEWQMTGDLPSVMSFDFLPDGPSRSTSFTHQLYALDQGRAGPLVPDQFAPNIIWQARGYVDTKLMFFESTALTKDMAAFTYTPIDATHKAISVCKYREPVHTAMWTAYAIDMQSHVESMAINENYAWLLTNESIFRTALIQNGVTQYAVLPASSSARFVTPFKDGVVCGFMTSPDVVIVSSSMALSHVRTPYRGVTCIAPCGDNLICGVQGSSVVRMLTVDGIEAHSYIGHSGPVMGVVGLTDVTFATYADDCTVRVWDVRDRCPMTCISTNNSSIVNLAGTRDHLVVACHNKTMGVFDIRRQSSRPVLCVSTQEYEPASMFYSQEDDKLAMFGVVDKEPTKDSMIFVDNDGQSRQRIFRVYDDFIGLGK